MRPDVPYTIPQAAPAYGPPPYAYRACPQLLVLFRSPASALRRLVPEPLVPNPDDLAFLMIGTMRTDEFGDYDESIIAVPAEVDGTAGNFVVFHYVEGDKPMIAGREIMGWPKRAAELAWSEDDGRITATVRRDGAEIIRAEARMEGPAAPDDLSLTPNWLNLKVIPSVVDGAPPAIAQITSTPLRELTVAQARRGSGGLTLTSIESHPVGLLEVDDVLGAVHALLSFDLPGGTVAHDYVAVAPASAATDGGR